MKDCCQNQEDTFGEVFEVILDLISPVTLFLVIVLLVCLYFYQDALENNSNKKKIE